MNKLSLVLLINTLPLFLPTNKVLGDSSNPTFGDFEVLNNTGCTIENNVLSATSGTFLAKTTSSITNNFHLSFNLNAQGNKDNNVSLILNGSTNEEGKLSGNLFRPYFDNGSWQMLYGTLNNDEFSQISDTSMDFGGNFGGNYDFYVSDGVVGFRMDGWCIATYDLVFSEGDTYFLGNNTPLTLTNPKFEEMQYNIGNYIYRDQWGGFNVHGFTTCFNMNSTHSFKMSIPSSVNKEEITKLYLVRGSVQRDYGQKCTVKINDTDAPEWENMSTTHKINGGVDTYSDAIYEISLDTIKNTNELKFDITNTDGELVIRGYKLIYETENGRFLADKIISGSKVSLDAHEFSYDQIGWTGSQYLFIDLAANGAKNKYFVGAKPLAKEKIITNFTTWTAQDIEITFTNSKPINIEFLDYISAADGFSYKNEIWFNSTKMGDGTSYQLNNTNLDVTYTIDFYIEGLDVSSSGTRKVSPAAKLQVTGYDSSNDGVIINVETDNKGLEENGFIRLFNKKASRKFELGSSKKDSTFTYEFTGSYITLVGYKGIAGGKFKVEIDNEEKGEFDTYAETDTYQTPLATIDSLENKKHTLKVTVSEDKFVAIDYLQFEIPKESYYKRLNLAQIGTIICSNPNPQGGGNRDLNVIRNENIAPIGSNSLGPSQYDSFDGSGKTENVFYMGYSFSENMKVSKVCYQAGCTWATGGWFKNGSLHLEALIDDTWTTVELLEDIKYPNSNSQTDFIPNNIYIFKFDQIECKGIRIIGDAGGSEHFVSVSEIEVYQELDSKSCCEGGNYRDPLEL